MRAMIAASLLTTVVWAGGCAAHLTGELAQTEPQSKQTGNACNAEADRPAQISSQAGLVDYYKRRAKRLEVIAEWAIKRADQCSWLREGPGVIQVRLGEEGPSAMPQQDLALALPR